MVADDNSDAERIRREAAAEADRIRREALEAAERQEERAQRSDRKDPRSQ